MVMTRSGERDNATKRSNRHEISRHGTFLYMCTSPLPSNSNPWYRPQALDLTVNSPARTQDEIRVATRRYIKAVAPADLRRENAMAREARGAPPG